MNTSLLAPPLIAPPDQRLSQDRAAGVIRKAFFERCRGEKVLVLIPDRTRTLPLPPLFQALADALLDADRVDFLIALGTHPPLPAEEIDQWVGMTARERADRYPGLRIFNHDYHRPEELACVGELPADQVRALAGEAWHTSLDRAVPVTLNRRALDYDRILILGPTFPHEVVGFSGGAKYLFPGIAGPEMINATHWLGALCGVQQTIGVKHTPVRAMIEAAADMVPVPVTLIALVIEEGVSGLFIGDHQAAWEAAADLSASRHIQTVNRRYRRVLSEAPAMYQELWTAAKAMYKVESVVEDGGELILYAPHLDTISEAHGKIIRKIGYHVMPYFLKQWDEFQEFPLAVLAHSTHLKGQGAFREGVEKPRIQVTLASQLPPETCRALNLGYQDPDSIRPAEFAGHEQPGALYVPRAGERLCRFQG